MNCMVCETSGGRTAVKKFGPPAEQPPIESFSVGTTLVARNGEGLFLSPQIEAGIVWPKQAERTRVGIPLVTASESNGSGAFFL